MKKFVSLLLALVMCISSANIVIADDTSPYSGGKGSANDPYRIVTEEDLFTLAEQVNSRNAYEGTYFSLENDITLTQPWIPIGVGEVDANTKEFIDNGSRSFKGIFDGNGNTISGVELNYYAQLNDTDKKNSLHEHDMIGFFGYTYHATIKGLTIEGNISGNQRVGGIVGYAANGSYIYNCVNKATVIGENKIGGIAGVVGPGDKSNQEKVIDGCVNEGVVISALYIYKADVVSQGVGGIVGYTDSVDTTISKCVNKGSVLSGYSLLKSASNIFKESSHYDGIGGIAGYVNAGIIDECENNGIVYSERRVGGIVGTLCADGTVTNSGSDIPEETEDEEALYENPVVGIGIVNLDAEDIILAIEPNYTHECFCFGGVVGINDGGTVENCYAYSTDIFGMQQVGGIVGRNNGAVKGCTIAESEIRGSSPDYSKSNGTVITPYYTYTGGVVGYNTSTIDECISKANTIYSLYNAVGGICGYDEPNFETLISNSKNIDCIITTDEIYEAEKGTSYNSRIGGIVGEGNNVENCSTEGEEGRILGNTEVGGIIGRNNGRVEECHNMGIVTGYTYTGGIAGVNAEGCVISNCYNERFFKGEGSYLGGVVGQNKGLVEECYNTGEIQTTGGLLENAGGVAGINNIGGVLNRCYNEAAVTGKNNVGGISGINSNGTVKNCYNEGAIFGQDKIGGIVGFNEWMSASSESAKDAYIINNFNKGTVDGDTDVSTVGGISGINQGYIDNCYNSGGVVYTDEQAGYRGLIVGQNDANLSEYSKIMNSYSREQSAPLCGNDVENVVDEDTVQKITKAQVSNTLTKLNGYVEADTENKLVEWGYKNGDAELLLSGEPSNIARITLEQVPGVSVSFTDTEENYKFIGKGESVSVKIELDEGAEFSGFMYNNGFIALDKMTAEGNVYTFNAPDEYDVKLKAVIGSGVFITSAVCENSDGNAVENSLDLKDVQNIKVSVMTTDTSLKGDAIAAAYDTDGNFVGIVGTLYDCELTSSETNLVIENVDIPSNAAKVVIFLWDGINSMKPIASNVYTVSFTSDYSLNGLTLYLDGLNIGGEDGERWYNRVGDEHYVLNNVTRTENGFSFNGTDSYAKSSKTVDMDDSERTIEIAFSNDSYNNSRSSYMFGMGTADATNILIGRNNAGKIMIYTCGNSYILDYQAADVKSIAFVVGESSFKVYINGAEAAEYNAVIDTSAGNVMLGNSSNEPTPERYWSGTIHSVRIYDRKLSASEIESNYAADVKRFR